MESKMDIIVVDNKTYVLDDQAVMSNRLFESSWQPGMDDGTPYVAEYHITAHDYDGHNYLIYWQFDAIQGQEPTDESDYPWDINHITKIITQ
jgi:hypothetical protein